MPVLIACEFSGTVRDAFISAGIPAVSCDLLPSETPGPHIQCNVLEILNAGWPMMLAFPPCTYLCTTANRWAQQRENERYASLEFVSQLIDSPIPRVAIENPVGVLSTALRKPDQIIHPYQFGHGWTKATCLWLFDLPPLRHTNIIPVTQIDKIHNEKPLADRWRNRSRTPPGIAKAMAEQWGKYAFL